MDYESARTKVKKEPVTRESLVGSELIEYYQHFPFSVHGDLNGENIFVQEI